MVGPAFVSSTGRRGRVVTPFLAAPGAPDELGGSSRAHRVALVSSSYFPHPGGVELHVRSVAGELRARGHDVVVWTVDRGEGLGVQVIDGVEVRYLPSPLPARSLGAVLRFLLDLPAAARAWWRAYRGFAPSILHVQCFGPNGLYALLLAHLTRTPLVVTSHGETFADDHRVFDRSALIRTGMRKALDSAEVVTGCSQVVLDDLKDRFGFEGGRVVPNGVDLDGPVVTPASSTAGCVFAVGRLEHSKGFDLLLEAFAVADLPSRIRLVIGGDGTVRPSLERRAKELAVGDRVHLTGRLEAAEVAAHMASAAVVVVPSRKEAFGLVVLEAWRAGAPLIVTSNGGPADLVTDGETGLVVDPEDATALARALELMLMDRATAERLGEAGRVAVRAFPWSRVAELYESCYDGGFA